MSRAAGVVTVFAGVALVSGCPAGRTKAPGEATLPDGGRLACPPETTPHAHPGGVDCVSVTSGRRHGPSVSWWPGGQPRARGAHDDGERVGEWTTFHQDGAVRARGRYQRGLRVGEWVEHGADGKPRRTEVLMAGEPVEVSEYTYGDDGALVRQRSRRLVGDEWVEHGEQRVRVADGLLAYRAEGGVASGLVRLVADDGVELIVAEADDRGLLHGPARGRRPSGVVAIEGTFDHGRMVGTWRYLDEAGAPRRVVVHGDDGFPRSLTTYHPAGGPALEATFDGEGPSGTWRRRAADGTVLVEGSYRSSLRDGEWRVRSPAGALTTTVHAGGLRVRGAPVPPLRWQPYAADPDVERFVLHARVPVADDARGPPDLGHAMACLAGLPPEATCDRLDHDQLLVDEEEYAAHRPLHDQQQGWACVLGNARACVHHAARLTEGGAPVRRAAGFLAAGCERLAEEQAWRRVESSLPPAAPSAAVACGRLGATIVDGLVVGTAYTGWDLLDRACDAGDGEACWTAASRLLAVPPVVPAGASRAEASVRGRELRVRACTAVTPSGVACAAIAAGLAGDAARLWLDKACDAAHPASCAALGREVPPVRGY